MDMGRLEQKPHTINGRRDENVQQLPGRLVHSALVIIPAIIISIAINTPVSDEC